MDWGSTIDALLQRCGFSSLLPPELMSSKNGNDDRAAPRSTSSKCQEPTFLFSGRGNHNDVLEESGRFTVTPFVGMKKLGRKGGFQKN